MKIVLVPADVFDERDGYGRCVVQIFVPGGYSISAVQRDVSAGILNNVLNLFVDLFSGVFICGPW